jgi:L-threonylcarbamoyladenylate synthase
MWSGPEEIAQAVARIRAGGVVAFPTETVYGLGASAFDAVAVRRIFELKGRPSNNPLIVHVSGEAMARRVVEHWPADAAALAREFWPGPLTMVLPKADAIPREVTAGGHTVGVRCPDHPLTLALLEASGIPLVGPSANISGQVSPTSAEHVRAAFGPGDVFTLDGGKCRGGIESTVLWLADGHAKILRPGLISGEQISAVLGRPVRASTEVPVSEDSATPMLSPGLLDRHYAPSAMAVRFEGNQANTVLRRMALSGRGVMISHANHVVPPPHRLIRMPSDASGYASRLYEALREADEISPSLIAVEVPPIGPDPIWGAIQDRLRRATQLF